MLNCCPAFEHNRGGVSARAPKVSMCTAADSYFAEELKRALGQAAASRWLQDQMCAPRSSDGSTGSVDSRTDDVVASSSALEGFRAAVASDAWAFPMQSTGCTRLVRSISLVGSNGNSPPSSPAISPGRRSRAPVLTSSNYVPGEPEPTRVPSCDSEPPPPALSREQSHLNHLHNVLQAGGENAGLIFTDAAHSVFRAAEASGNKACRQ